MRQEEQEVRADGAQVLGAIPQRRRLPPPRPYDPGFPASSRAGCGTTSASDPSPCRTWPITQAVVSAR